MASEAMRTDSSSKIVFRRKRGRPPKLNRCKSDASCIVVDSAAMASENARGCADSSSTSSAEAEKTLRKRGRPPKLNRSKLSSGSSPVVVDNAAMANGALRRCRGRDSSSASSEEAEPEMQPSSILQKQVCLDSVADSEEMPRKSGRPMVYNPDLSPVPADSVEAEPGKRGRQPRSNLQKQSSSDSPADSVGVREKTAVAGGIPRKRGRPPKSTRRKLFSSDRSIKVASTVQIAVRVVARRRKEQQQESKWFPEVTRDVLVAIQRLPLRTEPCDFQLPPSWCKRSEKHDPRAPQFLHIKRNVYLIKKPRKKAEDEGMQCSCKLQQCGSNCICRMLYTSCTFDCACDGLCGNLPFQKLAGRKLKLAETEGCGWGVFADEDITKGEFLIEYVGEVIDDKMCEERLWAMKECGETKFYLCEVSRDVVIDATRKGNISRFINHSCEPNAELRKWECDGEVRIGVFAITSISKGQQVTYDYQYIQFGTEQKCQCGAASCKGVLGSKFAKKPVEKDHLQEGMLPLTRVFPHRKKTATQPPDGPLPGNRVRVWWPLDQKYYSGRIVHFNSALGKHQILYDDGDKEELTLCKEVWALEKQE